jgi:hypothetical protein
MYRGYGHPAPARRSRHYLGRSVTCQEGIGQTPLFGVAIVDLVRVVSPLRTRVIEAGVSKMRNSVRVAHRRMVTGLVRADCRLNDAPGRAAWAETGEPAQGGLLAAEGRRHDEL